MKIKRTAKLKKKTNRIGHLWREQKSLDDKLELREESWGTEQHCMSI